MIAIARPSARFEIGQLVRHRRYGYRGVVVAIDSCCRAPAHWYQRNQTQPDRQQPWYHVLVHEQQSATYAAQTSLLVDQSDEPVDNPLVDAFFEAFHAGRYQRNRRPWQGW